ncbi:MAG: hypothetical protein OQK93_05145, partial [Gammaproteobacteria bacterium]|nr:hypothetical protein [Gammaproteobacteria bacterium]
IDKFTGALLTHILIRLKGTEGLFSNLIAGLVIVAYMDVGSRATQEQLPKNSSVPFITFARSRSWKYREKYRDTILN